MLFMFFSQAYSMIKWAPAPKWGHLLFTALTAMWKIFYWQFKKRINTQPRQAAQKGDTYLRCYLLEVCVDLYFYDSSHLLKLLFALRPPAGCFIAPSIDVRSPSTMLRIGPQQSVPVVIKRDLKNSFKLMIWGFTVATRDRLYNMTTHVYHVCQHLLQVMREPWISLP